MSREIKQLRIEAHASGAVAAALGIPRSECPYVGILADLWMMGYNS